MKTVTYKINEDCALPDLMIKSDHVKVCPYCGSDNIRQRIYQNPNTHQFYHGEDDDYSCEHCGNTNFEIISEENL